MSRAADEAIALAFAHGLPYAGLRDERNDDALVPADVARAARVVALRADGERVRLAAAEPEPDLSALGDHLGGRSAEIVIAAARGDRRDPRPGAAARRDRARADRAEPPEPTRARARAGHADEEPSWLAPEPARTARRR